MGSCPSLHSFNIVYEVSVLTSLFLWIELIYHFSEIRWRITIKNFYNIIILFKNKKQNTPANFIKIQEIKVLKKN